MIHTLNVIVHAPPIVWVLAAGGLGWWRLHVEFHPFRRCSQCKGTGWNRGSTKDAYGLCKHGPRETRFAAKGAAARHLRRRGQ